MVRGSRHTGLSDSKLVRLLADLRDSHEQPSEPSLFRTLGTWLDWTHAIELAAVLDERDAAARSAPPSIDVQGLTQRIARLRDRCGTEIERAFSDQNPDEPDSLRRHYRACQQAMEDDIASARQALRQALAAGSAELARLARLDEVMERVLGERERVLLSAIPRWLEQRPLGPSPRKLLLAELDLRLQPLEGLLETLRSQDPRVP
jgi:hypothetical protein